MTSSVLFTGANLSLGKALAIGLTRAGADVTVVGRSPEQDVIDQINAQGVRGACY